MQYSKYWISGLLIVLTLTVVGCGAQVASVTKIQPYSLEAGTDGINTVTLTERAVERLAVETAPVTEEQIDGNTYKVIPYGALIYDNTGGTWIYVNVQPLTFKRTAVTVDFIKGDRVALSAGPETGTQVATVAVAELYGTDTGVGK
jgi:hypothetical protein